MLKKQQEDHCGQNGVNKKKKSGQREKKEIGTQKAFDRTWPFILSKMRYYQRVLARRQNPTYRFKRIIPSTVLRTILGQEQKKATAIVIQKS